MDQRGFTRLRYSGSWSTPTARPVRHVRPHTATATTHRIKTKPKVEQVSYYCHAARCSLWPTLVGDGDIKLYACTYC